MAKTGTLVDARRVNEEYRHWVTDQPKRYAGVRGELADFTKYAEAYRRYESANAPTLPSTDLRRVLIDFDVSTALPLLLFLELDAGLTAPDTKECLFIVESFFARRLLAGADNKEYNKLFVEVVGSIRGTPADAVKQALITKLLSGGGSTRYWPTDEQIVEAAISRSIFTELRTPALRLILERLEVALRGKKTEGTDVPAGLQIEHVMPQNWAAHWPIEGKMIPPNVAAWPYLAKDELEPLGDAIRARNARVHTLGNLTLLNRYLNPAASNAAFTEKLVEYKNSVLRLNRYFDARTTWDEPAIADRGKALGELLCKVWPRRAQSRVSGTDSEELDRGPSRAIREVRSGALRMSGQHGDRAETRHREPHR